MVLKWYEYYITEWHFWVKCNRYDSIVTNNANCTNLGDRTSCNVEPVSRLMQRTSSLLALSIPTLHADSFACLCCGSNTSESMIHLYYKNNLNRMHQTVDFGKSNLPVSSLPFIAARNASFFVWITLFRSGSFPFR